MNYQIQNDRHLSDKNAYSKSPSRLKYDFVTKYGILGSLILFCGILYKKKILDWVTTPTMYLPAPMPERFEA